MDTERFQKQFKFLEVAIVDTRKGVKPKTLEVYTLCGWKAFTEEVLRIICSSPYVKSVTHKMIRFTKEFKEQCWRRYSEEHQTARETVIDLGFDPEILGQKKNRWHHHPSPEAIERRRGIP